MTTTTSIDRAVGEYVGRCVEHLRDLAVDQRNEVLDDIRHLVAEVSAELGGDPLDLLGPPERFVAELRNAAGLQPREAPVDPQRPATTLGAYVSSLEPGVHRIVKWLLDLVRDLRPAGWILRGYTLAALIPLLLNGRAGAMWFLGFVPIPAWFGSSLLGLVVTVATIGASIAIGRRGVSGWLRVAVALATLVSTLFFFAALSELRHTTFYPPSAHVADVPVSTTIVRQEAPRVPAVIRNAHGVAMPVDTIEDLEAAWYELTNGLGTVPVTVEVDGLTFQAFSFEDLWTPMVDMWGVGSGS